MVTVWPWLIMCKYWVSGQYVCSTWMPLLFWLVVLIGPLNIECFMEDIWIMQYVNSVPWQRVLHYVVVVLKFTQQLPVAWSHTPALTRAITQPPNWNYILVSCWSGQLSNIIHSYMNTVSLYFLEQCCRLFFLPFALPNLTKQEHLVGEHANDHVHVHHTVVNMSVDVLCKLLVVCICV